ncbi:cyclase family protein [Amycolatopsis sp. 195334CR]|uniref:cyclase family protein n=1 Tax=Amycolatopsis sp. 195334CR TaxID=2814588 RepID=UPI001A8F5036|nr:cyclase family protein [Amycolatopsis sp. 195334CR]MBN6040281.1 cyclase family protein [Amycolatopsis sp. 195334CR]
MNPDLLRNYLSRHSTSRRTTLRLAGAAGAVAVASSAGVASASAPAAPAASDGFDDTPFDYADPANLADWAPSRYGAGDQRGAFNEVTPGKTASALSVLKPGRPVRTYNLGELMWNGFPAFKTNPRRIHELRLTIAGYEPPPGFLDAGGVLMTTEPLGANKLSYHEERFAAELSPQHPVPLATTYQIASQLDNLCHVGAAEYYYNGFRGPEFAAAHGATKLGNEHMGPIVTRGVLLDILGVKLAEGASGDLAEPASNGKPLLRENYRITVEDIKKAMDFGGIKRITPGDVVLFRTGWNQLLARRDPADVLRWEGPAGLPGIYLREARWLAQFRPAVVGSDTWALEVVGNPVNDNGAAFPVHQELLMRNGIRIGESYVLDGPADDRVYEFVFAVTPQFTEGATAGNTPPLAMGQPRRH